MQWAAALGPALSFKERRRRLVCFAEIPKSCRNLFSSPLPRPPLHSTPVASKRDLSSSNLPSYISHHLLSLLALHHSLTLLSSGRLVPLISPSMDSLLWPRCELSSPCCLEGRRAEAARLVGLQTFLFFFSSFSQLMCRKYLSCLHCHSATAQDQRRSNVLLCAIKPL